MMWIYKRCLVEMNRLMQMCKCSNNPVKGLRWCSSCTTLRRRMVCNCSRNQLLANSPICYNRTKHMVVNIDSSEHDLLAFQ
jgi:hypothetical protein